MIYTSYFAKIKDYPDMSFVSVSRFTPKAIKIPVLLYLAPSSDVLRDYKEDKDLDKFIRKFNKQLKMLDADTVASALNNRVLVCYEKSDDFCHRHIIAQWLRNHGYEVEELE